MGVFPLMPKLRKGAFTLIELLVVIAIIAILAAILFPVFAQAKLAAKKTAAISNSKQISLGLIQYMGDNEDRFPMLEWGSPYSYLMTWPEITQPYIKNWQIFRDPSDGSSNDSTFAANWGLPASYTQKEIETARGYGSNYGFNYAFLAPGVLDASSNPIYGGGVSQTQAANPADTVMLVDGTVWGAGGNAPEWSPTAQGGRYCEDAAPIYDSNDVNYSTTTLYFYGWFFADSHGCSWQRYGGAYPRYTGKFNVSWVDGHVSSRAPFSMIAGIKYDEVTPQFSAVIDKSVYVWDLE